MCIRDRYKNGIKHRNLELDLKAKAMNFTQDPSWVYQWNLQQIGLETALTAIGQETKDVAVAVLVKLKPALPGNTVDTFIKSTFAIFYLLPTTTSIKPASSVVLSTRARPKTNFQL